MDFTQINPGFWALLLYGAIFLSLVAIPWTVGAIRPLILLVGIGGLAALLGFDHFVGVQKSDYDLAANLMLLTLSKAVFFFLISYAAEKLFRVFFRQSKEQKTDQDWREEELAKSFDRNMRGLKNPDQKSNKS